MSRPASTVEAPLRQVPGGWAVAPEGGRVVGVVVLGIFAAFWNGLVWTGLMAGFREMGWFILIPGLFAVVGVGVVLLFLFALAKLLFTPQPQLVLEAPVLTIGGTTAVRWTLVGSVQRLASLAVTLVAYEETEYTRGTTTSTDRNDLRKIPVWSTRTPASAGKISITVPTDLPPTWRGRDNRLRWKIVVQGQVRGAPNVDDAFPVTVVPAQAPESSLVVAGPAVGDPPLGITLSTPVPVPGEAMAAQVRWRLDHPPRELGLRVTWKVTGKGGVEQGAGPLHAFPGGQTDGVSVAFVLPSLPPLHQGKLVSVLYRLELVADGKVIHAVQI